MLRLLIDLPDSNITLVRNICVPCARSLGQDELFTFTFRGTELTVPFVLQPAPDGISLCHICPKPSAQVDDPS